jgi:hypothetical protein
VKRGRRVKFHAKKILGTGTREKILGDPGALITTLLCGTATTAKTIASMPCRQSRVSGSRQRFRCWRLVSQRWPEWLVRDACERASEPLERASVR